MFQNKKNLNNQADFILLYVHFVCILQSLYSSVVLRETYMYAFFYITSENTDEAQTQKSAHKKQISLTISRND